MAGMTTKLTLSIEKKTIERAKILSSKRGKSISKIVEEYLNTITDKEENKRSAVKKLSGVLKNKVPGNISWKEVKSVYLRKKYGL
jgi:hypothetical protein